MKKARTILLFFGSVLTSSIFAQYNLQGDGFVMGDNCYQLTSATYNQVSTIWYEELIDLNQPFELQFKMNFGDLNGENGEDIGADGMMFVLQNNSSTAMGIMGEGMGYGNMDPSLGIEFDTYYNPNLQDMYPDHIAIHRDGNTNHNSVNALAGPIQADPEDVDIEDGEDHAISITWDPSSQEISVFFDCQYRLSANIDLVNDIFSGESEVWWGFSASTGGSYNVHTVCLYENVSPSSDIAICPGYSTQLIAGGDIYSEYSWSPIDYLDDPTAYNPIASPPSSQVYSVTYTDFCGQTQSNTIEVTVEPIEAQILADDDAITCLNEEVNLTAYTNYPNAQINWSVVDGTELSDVTNNTATATGEGVYLISVTSYDGNCSSEDVFEVLVDTVSFEAITGPADVVNCNQPSIILQGESNSDEAEFVWSTTDGQFLGSSFTQTPTVISEGQYTLTVINPNNGCETVNHLEIEEDFTAPEITLGQANGLISCITPVVQIDGNDISPDGYTNLIEWTEYEGELFDPLTLNPSTQWPGSFGLTVTFEENGCSTTTTETVEVEQDEYAFISLESLVIPNIFTPNGDAVNNVFRPKFSDPELQNINPLDVLDYWKFKVLDRWGMLVYENNGDPEVWHGTNMNGRKVSSETYIIEISFESNCIETQSGEYIGSLKVISD